MVFEKHSIKENESRAAHEITSFIFFSSISFHESDIHYAFTILFLENKMIPGNATVTYVYGYVCVYIYIYGCIESKLATFARVYFEMVRNVRTNCLRVCLLFSLSRRSTSVLSVLTDVQPRSRFTTDYCRVLPSSIILQRTGIKD